MAPHGVNLNLRLMLVLEMMRLVVLVIDTKFLLQPAKCENNNGRRTQRIQKYHTCNAFDSTVRVVLNPFRVTVHLLRLGTEIQCISTIVEIATNKLSQHYCFSTDSHNLWLTGKLPS